jgi:predicted nucleic acid-binding protein
MDVIVNDASALLDIYKAGLLVSYSKLPCRLILPDLVARELRSLGHLDLLSLGFEILSLDTAGVTEVIATRNRHAALSNPDTFALVLAATLPGSILLTGDGALRRVAEERGIRVHGVLWLIDTLFGQSLIDAEQAIASLLALRDDAAVWLPERLMSDYLERYRRTMS